MNKFVVKQPIKTRDNILVGNELLFNVSNELYNERESEDYRVAETISAFLTQNSGKIDKSGLNFITFTPNLLFKKMPEMFMANELVIQIEDNVITHPNAHKIIENYKQVGYQIAINDFQFLPRYFGFLEYTDYIKVNVRDLDETSIDNILRMAKGFGKKCIATHIDRKELYQFAARYPFDLFEGVYVAEAGMIKAEKMHYMRSNFFQLVIAVTKEIPDVDEIELIITRDASLTYRLLRIVNSAHFALRHKTASVKQAIMVLGIDQLKKWVYLLSFDKDTEIDSTSEDVLKLSLLRATFCSELIGIAKDMPITKSEGYLMGMFSSMGLLVDAPMGDILKEVPLSDTIRNALIRHEGRCAILLDLVFSYERAEWDNIKKFAEKLNIPGEFIAQIYFDCVENVNQIWKELKETNFEELEEELAQEELAAKVK